jgi:4-amino-4-deoxy-L-arabinose transferase-like glycosyltransferase
MLATPTASTYCLLGLILLLFLALRLPPVLQQPGSQDEEWYGIPGLMVAREGVPRVPYSHATDSDSVFLGAERLLYAMPPGLFYAQAPFFWVLPPNYATARMASLAAGCLAIGLVFAIGREVWGSSAAALASAAMYSASRLLFFPAMIARPDMLCGALGLTSVWCLLRWRRTRSLAWLAGAGAWLGLAGLTHPFALVFAFQIVAWVGWTSETVRLKLRNLTCLIGATSAAFALWLPLIALAPDLFRLQFLMNILKPAGPGLLWRLLNPWSDIAHDLPGVIERTGFVQGGAWILAGLWVSWCAVRTSDPAARWLAIMAWSGVYLLFALQGRHPLQGYWCYPVAYFAVAAGGGLAELAAAINRHRQHLGTLCAGSLALAVLFPGSGLRATAVHLQHWGDPAYDSRRFTRELVQSLPPDAHLTVGIEFALDAYGLGRNVTLGIRHPLYFDSTQIPTDYVLLGRMGLREQLDSAFGGRVLRTTGRAEDEWAGYAVILTPEPFETAPTPEEPAR